MDPNISDFGQQEFPLEKYWEIVKKRRLILIAFALFTFVVILIPVYRQVPIYEASGILMIDRESGNMLIFNDYYTMQSGMMDDYFNSQVRILRSRTLARNTLEELDMLKAKTENPAGANTNILRIFRKNEAAPDEEAQISGMVSGFLGNLLVAPIKESRLVEVRFRSPSPQFAARAVNMLFQKFIEFNLKIKTESTRMASESLTLQIEEVRKTLSQKEQELQQYGEKKELFYLSSQESTVVDKFADINKAYTQAQIDRINKEAAFRELQGKPYDNLPDVRNNTLIQTLKKEYSTLEGEYRKKEQSFKEDYPEMKRLKSQLESLQARIDKEVRDNAQKALSAAESEYQGALKKESYLSSLLTEQRRNVVSTNTNAIYYNSLKIEVENMRNLLDYLVKKQKESLLTSQLEGLQTSNIKVVDEAEVPNAPLSSSKRRALLLALFLGIGGGMALVFGLDYLDRTLSTPEDVEKFIQLPTMGMIPALGSQNYAAHYAYYAEGKNPKKEKEIKEIELVNYHHLDSTYAEHYRNIRTSLMLSTPKASPRMIVITSSMPSEGKTVTAINIAVSFAQLGKKVLLMDLDLRKPRIHRIFRLKNTEGAASFLVGRSKLENIIFGTSVPGLSVIPSGPIPPNPVELLNSDIAKSFLHTLPQIFDIVFIDSPPLVNIVDPIIIGKETDGVMLVVWGGKTNRKIVERVKSEFDKYSIRLFGVVLNRLSRKHHSGYYSSYGYKYGASDKRQQV